MATNQRFNMRNKTVGEANTKLILASLKSGPKTITDLVMVTGLTRQTITKKLNSNSDLILSTEGRPAQFYLKGVEYKTVVDEVVDKESERKPATKLAKVKAAIVNSESVVFFPGATHNDLSVFHDMVINGDANDQPLKYADIASQQDLMKYEHNLKTMYDLIQFRKSLKEFE